MSNYTIALISGAVYIAVTAVILRNMVKREVKKQSQTDAQAPDQKTQAGPRVVVR